MPVKITYKNRRDGKERRTRFSIYDGSEKRSGEDRRKLDEKLKNMIQKNIADQKEEPPAPLQQIANGVIRRRKAEKDKKPAP